MRHAHTLTRPLLGCAALLFVAKAEAQLDVTQLAREQPELVSQLARLSHSSLLTLPGADNAAWQSLSRTQLEPWSAGALAPGTAGPNDDSRLVWSAPRRLLMDQARRWIGLERLDERLSEQGDPSLTGQGVVVGIVDGGLDFAHPDFQNADGTTRIAWLLDFGLPPLGIHPGLEQEYGCDGEQDFQCGILSAVELAALIDGDLVSTADGLRVSPIPDRLGHGTHVASLAAGNGQSDARYQGVAPEATLIVANASDEINVSDAIVLLASRFIFDRAAELGVPAVVNLSLGGDFGPHDGSSAIEAALAELVGPPGRAIVVAAGNSGILYQGEIGGYEGPFGIHADVHLSHAGSARVPVLLPNAQPGDSALLVWIEGPLDDTFKVGLERGNGDTLVPPIGPGLAVGARDDGREILIINHVVAPDFQGGENFGEGAVVVISGDFSRAPTLALRLEGEGNANLWLEALGGISKEGGAEGAFFPGATRAGTVTLPATSPKVIAVGATVNRNTWPSRDDGEVALADFGLPRFRHPDTPAFFSSQGPNLDGVMKPDILAPGFAVIGAMGANADPVARGLPNALSMFAFSPVCDVSSVCSVVDGAHGVAVGTSMSAPIVAGAVALLLQRAPESTQEQLLHLLQAGSRKLNDTSERAEPGSLDIAASVRALELDGGARAPKPDTASFLSLGAGLAYPDPAHELEVQLHLRAGSELADAQTNALEVELDHGTMVAAPRKLAPGLFAFRVAASRGSAEERLTVRVRHAGQLLTERSLPIAVDPNVGQRGVSVRGGCSFAREPARTGPANSWGCSAWAPLLLALLVAIRRRTRAAER